MGGQLEWLQYQHYILLIIPLLVCLPKCTKLDYADASPSPVMDKVSECFNTSIRCLMHSYSVPMFIPHNLLWALS